MNMKKRWTGLMGKRDSFSEAVPALDSPEASAARGVKLFCESGGPNNAGEEVLHLPVIVEAAESSPKAAAAAASQIRKFLKPDNSSRPHVQYNAIMLIRILADNPGKTFTRNFDGKFVATVKDLLRQSRDPSVQQLMRETLDALEAEKSRDEGLTLLLAMWRGEKGNQRLRARPNGPSPQTTQQQWGQQQGYPKQPSHRGLPSPEELAQRIEEARTSAKLLLQLIQSTPPSEVLSSDLIKEFADRCQSAQRSMQAYINSENPGPDDDTLQTLIETNEQLSLACSRHQRAVLQARRTIGAVGMSPSPPVSAAVNDSHEFIPPPGPPPSHRAQQPASYPPPPTSVRQPQTGFSPPPVPPSMQTRLYQRTLSHENKAAASTEASLPAQTPNSDPFSDAHRTPEPIRPVTQQEPAELESPVEASHPPIFARQEPVELWAPHESLNYGSSAQATAFGPNTPSQPPRPPRPPIPAAPPLDTAYTPPSPRGPPMNAANHNSINRESDLYNVSPITNNSTRQSNMYDTSPVELPAQHSPAQSQPQPYHPGYKTTPSYVQRQDSSINHVTMSGAGAGAGVGAGGGNERANGAAGGPKVARLATRLEEEEEEERLSYASPTCMRRGDWVD